MRKIEFVGLENLPEIKSGDRLAPQIVAAAEHNSVKIEPGDIVIVAQKIVSKAENRTLRLCDVEPSAMAYSLALERHADPRLIEIVLRESRSIVRLSKKVMITETHHGFICANSGVDRSNVPGEDTVCLLPVDPDASARKLLDDLRDLIGIEVAVIVTDTFGRPWRKGLLNFAIGIAGINPLTDFRGQVDDHGAPLNATILATADEIAAASGLLMRKTARTPVVLAKGFSFDSGEYSVGLLLRPEEQDLFR